MFEYPRVAICLTLILTGCDHAKSVEFYMKNPSEARETTKRCIAHGDAGENCGNAAVAVRRTARIEFDRQREAQMKSAKSGSWRPTWNGK